MFVTAITNQLLVLSRVPMSAGEVPAFRSRMVAVMFLATVLSGCGKSEPIVTVSPAPTPPPKVTNAGLEAEIAQALSPPKDDPSASDALADEVADIRHRHPEKNAKQLLEVPEVKAKMAECLKELSQRKDLQQRINATIDMAAAMKGLDGPPESRQFSLDLTRYSDGRTDQMLRAVMSGSATQITDFLVGEVGEATPELGLGGVSRSSNGIAIEAVSPRP